MPMLVYFLFSYHNPGRTDDRISPEEEESAVRFRKVEDPAKIEELENGPKVQ